MNKFIKWLKHKIFIWEYFNENGQGIPIQRKCKICGLIQTRYILENSHDKWQWYNSDINGKEIKIIHNK